MTSNVVDRGSLIGARSPQLQFLSTGFNMLRIGGSASSYAREMVWGGVLLLVMVLNYLSNPKLERQ